jgi:hypothetical protein
MDVLSRRGIVRFGTLVVLAGAALAVALGLGLPDPGAAERSFAAFVGVLSCALIWGWLRSTAAGRSPQGRFSVAVANPAEPERLAPAVVATKSLERGLGLGSSNIGSYNLFVRPRLEGLAAAKLARAGCRLDDANAARELLGDGWALVDPTAPPPADRMAPGVSLHRIGQLVQQLERLP